MLLFLATLSMRKLLPRQQKCLLLKITPVQSASLQEQKTHLAICSKQIPHRNGTSNKFNAENAHDKAESASIYHSFRCVSGGQKQATELSLSLFSSRAVQALSQQQDKVAWALKAPARRKTKG